MKISDDVVIDERELELAAARSSGPGGQHVNKTETKVVLTFDLDRSQSLTPQQKELLRGRLHGRLTRDGRLRLSSQRYRSRAANERDVRDRFAQILEQGLRRPARRKPTRVPAAAKRRRLEDKRKRSVVKRCRERPRGDDDR